MFAFEGDGVVKDFPGNYTQYKNKKEEEELLRKQEEKKIPVAPKPVREKEKDRKLTFRKDWKATTGIRPGKTEHGKKQSWKQP